MRQARTFNASAEELRTGRRSRRRIKVLHGQAFAEPCNAARRGARHSPLKPAPRAGERRARRPGATMGHARCIRLVVPAVLATGLVAAGCRPRAELTATASPTAVATSAPAAATSPSRRPQRRRRGAPIDLLPEGTGVVVSAASIRHVLRVVDAAALIGTYRPYYDQAAAYLEQGSATTCSTPGGGRRSASTRTDRSARRCSTQAAGRRACSSR